MPLIFLFIHLLKRYPLRAIPVSCTVLPVGEILEKMLTQSSPHGDELLSSFPLLPSVFPSLPPSPHLFSLSCSREFTFIRQLTDFH